MKGSDFIWWRHGVIYQIYPRSFYDSNGDGIGDIAGIIEKLDYLEYLGIDGIWLSPVNTSPMFDFGYDISDFRGIDPIFGTAEDFRRFIKEAHRRNIRIIMDLVLNHTSHLHPWFIESRSSRDNPKRHWYIWHDGKKGKAPNNWLAAFGGRAWEWDDATGQFYLHTFLKEQPDINWRNGGLKRAVFDDIRYWLDQGIDGFRLDVVNWYVKDDRFRSNPCAIGPYPRPYDLQRHIYDRNRPEMHDIMREFRSLLNRYDGRMAVGEVYCPQPGDPEMSARFLGDGEDELHLAFDFSLLFAKYGARSFAETLKRWYRLIPEQGWPCNVLNNHDQPRSISRYGRGRDTAARAKVLAAMLLTVRGTPFIYYGEEIGMRNGRIRRRDYMDPLGKKYWPFHKGRDGERTPMQWSAAPNGGFTDRRPWLPVNCDFDSVNMETQAGDPDSILNFYRRLIILRKEKPVLMAGDMTHFTANGDVMAFCREKDPVRIQVRINFSSKVRPVGNVLDSRLQILLGTHRGTGSILPSDGCTLSPYEVLIMEEIKK